MQTGRCIFYANGGRFHPPAGDFSPGGFGFRISKPIFVNCHRGKPDAGRTKWMKQGLKICVVAALAFLMAGCGGSDKRKEEPTNYDGWMLARWDDSTDLSGKVFLQLNEDMTFTLYQCIDTPGYQKLTGTYTKEGQVLSGTYSGGTPWESSYAIEKQTATELQLRSETNDIVSLYTAVEIPAYAKDGVVGAGVRSLGAAKPFL